MMKKYKPIGLYIDDIKCRKMLEDMAEQGWILESCGDSFFVFRKGTPQTLHYYIDYNRSDPEYDALLKEMGYRFVDARRTVRIYCSAEELPELQTDPVTRMMALNELIPASEIWFSLLLAAVIVFAALMTSGSLAVDLFSFFFHSTRIMYRILMLVLAGTLVLYALLVYLQRRSIRRQAEGIRSGMDFNIAAFYFINILSSVLLILVLCLYWLTYHDSLFVILYPLLILGSTWIARTIMNRYISTMSRKDKRTVLSIILVMGLLFFRFAINAHLDTGREQVRKTDIVTYHDPQTSLYSEETNPILQRISIFGADSHAEEIAAECSNGFVADTVFRKLIRYAAYMKNPVGRDYPCSNFTAMEEYGHLAEGPLPSYTDALELFVKEETSGAEIYTIHDVPMFNDIIYDPVTGIPEADTYVNDICIIRKQNTVIMIRGFADTVQIIREFHTK